MKKIVTHKELLEIIDEFLCMKNMKPHDFGKKYFNDSGFLPRLKEGSDPRLSTVIKLVKIVGK